VCRSRHKSFEKGVVPGSVLQASLTPLVLKSKLRIVIFSTPDDISKKYMSPYIAKTGGIGGDWPQSQARRGFQAPPVVKKMGESPPNCPKYPPIGSLFPTQNRTNEPDKPLRRKIVVLQFFRP
jgi:hypothetical protein